MRIQGKTRLLRTGIHDWIVETAVAGPRRIINNYRLHSMISYKLLILYSRLVTHLDLVDFLINTPAENKSSFDADASVTRESTVSFLIILLPKTFLGRAVVIRLCFFVLFEL